MFKNGRYSSDIILGDFLSLCSEPIFQTVKIIDLADNDSELHFGDIEETPEDLLRMVIQTWDYISNDGVITFYVDSKYEGNPKYTPVYDESELTNDWD